ncbi:unnamed protein product [Brassica rapa subsp. trilocularis]
MGGHLCHALIATKKLERHGNSLNCTRCVTSDVTGVVSLLLKNLKLCAVNGDSTIPEPFSSPSTFSHQIKVLFHHWRRAIVVIREAAIFTISFVACDSPSGNQLLWSIFKALRTFCAYQTFSFSCNAFRALLYIESLEPPLPPFPTPPSTLSTLEGPLSPLLFPSPDVVGEIRSVQGLISKTSQPRAELLSVS